MNMRVYVLLLFFPYDLRSGVFVQMISKENSMVTLKRSCLTQETLSDLI